MTFYKLVLYLTPPLLLLTTTVVFRYASISFGPKTGYFIGFLFYWLFWCLTIPLLAIGWAGIKASFIRIPKRITRMTFIDIFLLTIPLFLGYGYAFPKALHSANLLIITTSSLLAVVNASLEEILWRATYIKVWDKNLFMNLFYPAIGFGIWHYAPQTVYQSNTPGATVAFIAVATIVGLSYGLVSRKYNSIFWATISHILFDFSGLGARLYFG
jgi:membrane protease YdiL (CAAX protease family)